MRFREPGREMHFAEPPIHFLLPYESTSVIRFAALEVTSSSA